MQAGELAQRALALDVFGNVILDAYEMRERSFGVMNGRDGEIVPEGSAVLAIVAENDVCALTGLDRIMQLCDCGRISVLPLEEAAIQARNFLRPVSGHSLEGWIAVDDRRIREARIGNDDPAGAGRQRSVPEPERSLEPELFRGLFGMHLHDG